MAAELVRQSRLWFRAVRKLKSLLSCLSPRRLLQRSQVRAIWASKGWQQQTDAYAVACAPACPSPLLRPSARSLTEGLLHGCT